MKMTRSAPPVVLVLAFVGGCWSGQSAVLSRHAGEFNCPESQVEVRDLGSGTYKAIGCGVEAIYVCVGDRNANNGQTSTSGTCVRNSEPTRY